MYSEFKMSPLLLLPHIKIAFAWIAHGKPLVSGRLCGRELKNLIGSKTTEVCKLRNPCLFKMLSVKAQKAPSQINFAYF